MTSETAPVLQAIGIPPPSQSPRPGPADLHLATIDAHGRLWLRRGALHLGWAPGRPLSMAAQDGVARLTDDAHRVAGIDVAVDNRYRLLIPFGLRAMIGFRPGVRILVVTVPADRSIAMLSVDRVVAAFVGHQ